MVYVCQGLVISIELDGKWCMSRLIVISRDTVMMLRAVTDPDGTKERRGRKLERRVYRSRVL